MLLVVALFLLLTIVPITYSRLQSNGISDANISTAFYVLDAGYDTKTVQLDNLIPSNQVYTYNFLVSNYRGNERADIDMEYFVDITTTTNLPLTYALYLNQLHSDAGANSVITSDIVEADEYGTYFKKMKTDYLTFLHSKNETNVYQLVVTFPEEYNTTEYQGVIEGINISINSRQKIKDIQQNQG